MKDPAFLFYSRDFYEGTRMMLPEERACYVDLLIMQHQLGYIPNDLKRVAMYCTGIDEATLKATLKAKFKQTDKGWLNEVLSERIGEREEYKDKQSLNGKIGQIMKKAKKACKPNEYAAFRKYFYEILGKKNAINLLENNETTLEGLLKASLKHLANADAIANANAIKGKGKGVEKPLVKKKYFESILFEYEDILPINKKELLLEWLESRAEKGSHLSKLEIKNLVTHFHETSIIELQEQIKISTTNGWSGLKYDNKSKSKNGSISESRRQVVEKIVSGEIQVS